MTEKHLNDSEDEPFSVPIQALRPGDYYRVRPDELAVHQLIDAYPTRGGARRRGQRIIMYRAVIHAANADGTPRTGGLASWKPRPVYPVSASAAGDIIRAAIQQRIRTNTEQKDS